VLHDAYQGPTSPLFVDDFVYYADALLKAFGDRVPLWLVSFLGGGRRRAAPGLLAGWTAVKSCANQPPQPPKSTPPSPQTFNEPFTTCAQQYGMGNYAPSFRGGDADRYRCGHYVLLAHARVKALHDSYGRGGSRMGIGLNTPWAEPMSGSGEFWVAAFDAGVASGVASEWMRPGA
jgi:beta-glucosidase/6-phospho-beta-glucosidase/beta-galactosidase